MPGLPSYEETQRGIGLCPLYDNITADEGRGQSIAQHPHHPHPSPGGPWTQRTSYPVNATLNHTPSPVRMMSQHFCKPFALHHNYRDIHRRVIPDGCLKAYAKFICAGEVPKLQVSLPPEWPTECATLTNYRYDTLPDTYSQAEPTLLLDRYGRPLHPGGNGNPFATYRIGDYLEAQDAIVEDELYQSSPTPASGHRNTETPMNGGTNTTYEEFSMEDDNRSRRRERTCAKGFFVICLIVSAIAIIVFLVIAVLKSVHII